ncbi:MAG: iron-sulfur cluster assembly accessory protein [Candidatus Thermoplasmatota archaeon]
MTPYSGLKLMTSTVENPVFVVTAKAAEMVKTIMKNEGRENAGLRVTVMPGGCAGYTYGLDFADAAEAEDITLEMEGLKIFINEDIQPLISGAKLDFVESLQGAGFVLDNPNATSSCGCGKSFM